MYIVPHEIHKHVVIFAAFFQHPLFYGKRNVFFLNWKGGDRVKYFLTMNNVVDDESSGDPSEIQEGSCPIPRMTSVSNPKKPLVPKYTPINDSFNPDLFQLYFSLVNFHLKPYDLSPGQEFSPALETFCTTFDDENENGEKKGDQAMQNMPEAVASRSHIVRKFLLECQKKFFELSSNPSLNMISILHNELFYASEVLRHHQPNPSLMNFCDMLMADTLDLYNSTIANKINTEYWDHEKTAEDVINDILKKEIELIRNLNRETFLKMSKCAILRALEKAPGPQAGKIKQWATQNEINIDVDK